MGNQCRGLQGGENSPQSYEKPLDYNKKTYYPTQDK